MKKIKLTESDLYRIIKQVLLEQDEEEKSFTFSPGTFKSFITSSSGERFVKHLNNKHDEIIVNGDLDLSETQIKSLPDNLRVEGWLNLEDCKNLQSLPDNLHVEGKLNLFGCKNLQSLGDNLYVKEWLDLRETPIQTLGDNLYVGGTLYLTGTKIQSLGDNLYVGEDLDLGGTQIQSLPDNLHVGKSLGLDYTKIQSLPDNLHVTDTIYIYGTPLNDNDKLVAKYKEKYTIDRTI